MPVEKGDVWWGPAPHKSAPSYRPWLVVSDDSHPFARNECICVALTTQQHPRGVSIPDDAWVRGGSQKPAYVSPWYVATMKHRDFDDQQGELSDKIVDAAVRELHEYTATSE